VMRALLRALLALCLIALLAASGLFLWARQWIETPVAGLQAPVAFEVARGATLRSVAASLEKQGMLDQPRAWIAWARLTGRAGGLKAGEYELRPGMSPRQLLDLLSSGDVILHSITFVEGSMFADMRKALVSNAAVRNDRQGATDEEIMRALGAAGMHPEGQFFPDTYHFARGTSDLEILQIAHRRLRDALETAWLERAPDLPLASPYEALILASIVEKETALDSERPQIAGVFIERLRRGMRLQTDPTVIYGMIATYDGNIRRVDLLRDTPYNTYTRAGLPPTPIAMPGLDSIRAAVKPDVTGALFFVATGAGDGSHYFSKTLAEHNAAVRRYLKTLRER
jgi:UPF0755 protein